MAMFSLGVTRMECLNPKTHKVGPRSLLLLENLRSGFDQMRLLDIKVGAETAVANWKGKSRFRAMKNSCVDQQTNSAVEGFRLEGIELPPQALQENLQRLIAEQAKGLVSAKAMKRFLLQKLSGAESLAVWLDVHRLGLGSEQHTHSAVWTAIQEINRLIEAVLRIPAPQQWIGSSIALALETGSLSKEPKVLLKVFDWGRADLTSLREHRALQPEERRSRLYYWRQYLRAVCRFKWDLCRLALHRCCCPAWTSLIFELRIRSSSFYSGISSEIVGMGLLQLPFEGGSSEIALPFITRSQAVTDFKPKMGTLHFHVQCPKRGVGPVGITLHLATGMDDILDTSMLLIVRVVGFERACDARLHLEAWRDKRSEPVPRGCAYGQTSSPSKIQNFKPTWDNERIEFHGLGSKVEEAVTKLRKAVFSAFEYSTTDVFKRLKASRNPSNLLAQMNAFNKDSPIDSFFQYLPPEMGRAKNNARFEQKVSEFSQRTVHWLDDDGVLPSHWI
eukprot:TRINITY_DN63758_c0_g1_i1.p1 TRINITY_DN63758_c0_g1~~TRINITY_DN63758_c0_g1_i1.p1  ORF type:complete len:537 (+),score=93.31 TRINITY_DN63758_c0_g1_i1:102-1613(+)